MLSRNGGCCQWLSATVAEGASVLVASSSRLHRAETLLTVCLAITKTANKARPFQVCLKKKTT